MGKVSIVSGLVLASALATSQVAFSQEASEAPDYLLMPVNAEVVFVTTGGAEPRADWSEAARENFHTHLNEQLATHGHVIAQYEEDDSADDIEQLLLLQDIITASFNIHLPHKVGNGWNNTDLTLGETAAMLRGETGADEAMFLDHYSQIESAGVFMVAVAAAAATQGAYTPASQNIRFSRLTTFDLNTGDVIETVVHGFGDPRDAGESSNIVRNLVRGMGLEAE